MKKSKTMNIQAKVIQADHKVEYHHQQERQPGDTSKEERRISWKKYCKQISNDSPTRTYDRSVTTKQYQTKHEADPSYTKETEKKL